MFQFRILDTGGNKDVITGFGGYMAPLEATHTGIQVREPVGRAKERRELWPGTFIGSGDCTNRFLAGRVN